MSWTLFKGEAREVTYRHQTVHADIGYYWEYDDVNVRDTFDFGDPVDNEAYLELFRTGELVQCIIRVTATIEGERGESTLGACDVHGANIEADLTEIADCYGLVDDAITAALEALDKRVTRLSRFVVQP